VCEKERVRQYWLDLPYVKQLKEREREKRRERERERERKYRPSLSNIVCERERENGRERKRRIERIHAYRRALNTHTCKAYIYKSVYT